MATVTRFTLIIISLLSLAADCDKDVRPSLSGYYQLTRIRIYGATASTQYDIDTTEYSELNELPFAGMRLPREIEIIQSNLRKINGQFEIPLTMIGHFGDHGDERRVILNTETSFAGQDVSHHFNGASNSGGRVVILPRQLYPLTDSPWSQPTGFICAYSIASSFEMKILNPESLSDTFAETYPTCEETTSANQPNSICVRYRDWTEAPIKRSKWAIYTQGMQPKLQMEYKIYMTPDITKQHLCERYDGRDMPGYSLTVRLEFEMERMMDHGDLRAETAQLRNLRDERVEGLESDGLDEILQVPMARQELVDFLTL